AQRPERRRAAVTSASPPSSKTRRTLLRPLRIVAGLSAPSAGAVEWPDGSSKIGFVFQEPTLMPWADVAANVRLPLKLAHADDAQARDAVRQALERVGLTDFAQSYPRELSGGMKMRASIARGRPSRNCC